MLAAHMWPYVLRSILSGVLSMSKDYPVSYLSTEDDPAVVYVWRTLQAAERQKLWNWRRLECPICKELLLRIAETARLSLLGV